MSEWIRVQDKLPRPRKDDCWVVTEDRDILEAYYVDHGPRGAWKDADSSEDLNIVVTHWMLIPTLPPRPQPRGPFEYSPCGGIKYGEHSLKLLPLNAACLKGLIVWLNEMTRKDKADGI